MQLPGIRTASGSRCRASVTVKRQGDWRTPPRQSFIIQYQNSTAFMEAIVAHR
jgi:hypothetical protein